MKKSDTQTDEHLALKAREDIDVFGELVDRYEKPLLRYILRISNISKEEAEEVLQESFVKAWRYINDYDPNQKFSSWIYRITHNETISEYRKKKSRGLDDQVEWDEDLFASLPGKTNIDKELNEKINTKHMRQAMQELPEKYRNAIVLRFLEEKTYEEMVDILHVPLGTAATLVNRAKKMFREKLLEQNSNASWKDFSFF